ncbi:alpha/beta fold hydrolase, partial [bacterium]|nr:alpha/beta fold hydrolase [bacterium]
MPTVETNNINCYYEIHGQGRPLVLIAGLGSDSQSWQSVLVELAKHFKVVVFDNRGIGRTKYPQENFDIGTMAQDTVGLIDTLGIERADILGHSMGGYIAQEVAIKHPQRVNKLILASVSAFTSQRNKLLFADLLCLLEGNLGTGTKLNLRVSPQKGAGLRTKSRASPNLPNLRDREK